jgi:hypothetical protein
VTMFKFSILILILLFPQTANAGEVSDATLNRLIPALVRVESKGDPKAIGDGGRAIGLLQIHRCYWQDAVEFDKTLGGKYEDCFDPDYAKRVVRAYLRRYGTSDSTLEQLARIHNGGPDGHKESATLKYWKKVKRELK